jgi:transcription antitermination protein NusB
MKIFLGIARQLIFARRALLWYALRSMPIPRQKFREIVFQLVYSSDFSEVEDADMIPFMMQQLMVTKKVMCLALERKKAIESKREEIDQLVAKTATAYNFERITRAEKNILRLTVFELLYDASIPQKVVIAEAIRLARKFATPEGAAFVNAILDTLYQGSKDAFPTR